MTETLPREDEEDKASGISWDARQGRSKLLMNILVNAINASTVHDYRNWLKSLIGIHWLCFPYIKKSEAEKVKAEIETCENWVNVRGNHDYILKVKLTELTELIMSTYKSQFMQVHEEESLEFDPKKILGFKK